METALSRCWMFEAGKLVTVAATGTKVLMLAEFVAEPLLLLATTMMLV